jgi:hypothetical protein
MRLHTRSEREMVPLTDSLASAIRWRYGDYEAMLRAEVDLMLHGQNDNASQGLRSRSDGNRKKS